MTTKSHSEGESVCIKSIRKNRNWVNSYDLCWTFSDLVNPPLMRVYKKHLWKPGKHEKRKTNQLQSRSDATLLFRRQESGWPGPFNRPIGSLRSEERTHRFAPIVCFDGRRLRIRVEQRAASESAAFLLQNKINLHENFILKFKQFKNYLKFLMRNKKSCFPPRVSSSEFTITVLTFRVPSFAPLEETNSNTSSYSHYGPKLNTQRLLDEWRVKWLI